MPVIHAAATAFDQPYAEFVFGISTFERIIRGAGTAAYQLERKVFF